MTPSLEADLALVRRIEAVPTILGVVCQTTGMGFAAITRVTEDRWLACAVRDQIAFGLGPGSELQVETTICNTIRESRRPVVIDHVAQDATYRDHRTPAIYGFQSYISTPIILADGTFFGTLCAIDPRPARLNRPEIVGMFTLFAELIAFHLNALKKIDTTEARLAAERETAVLREQFVAVLAHDLRNPLAAIDAGTRLISKTPINEKAAGLLVHMHRSVGRMMALIDNVLDFAGGRLGGGMALTIDTAEPLEPMLEQVLSELRTAWPERRIEARFTLNEPVACDRVRIGQLFSNLLGNAMAHGAEDQTVRVRATADGGSFELSVANGGEPIDEAARQRLFQPFFRGEVRSGQQGLGLGLYIASEIARAHGGTLDVTSTREETRFTARIPTKALPAT